MPQIKNWEQHIGRRIQLRDLFVFFTVADCGSMARAAKQLGVSTPSVSELITGLEQVIGARLFDRVARGVVLTAYGEILLGRARAAFDELRQGVRHIEFISGSATGEVTIGCPESLAHFLIMVIERVQERYPRIRFNVQQVRWPTVDFPELYNRKVDAVLARLVPNKDKHPPDDLRTEVLFDDPFAIVVGAKSKLARRRQIGLRDLANERWVSTPLDVLAGMFVSEAFTELGLQPPVPHVATSSIHLRNNLASRGDYVAVLPRSVLRLSAKLYGLKELPIKLSSRPSTVALVSLKGRRPMPAVDAFFEATRAVAGSF